MGFVFVASIFTSAFLLFLVQPLITKLLLPSFGGSPAVWNTALVFFQTLLLGGYLYAHLLVRRTRRRGHLWMHGVVLLAPLAILPPTLPAVLDPSLSRWPAGLLLGALAYLVGAPFLVLSTNSSLVQHWWSRAGIDGGEDPYWLYGASNVGSLLALLAYPFVIEPAFSIRTQLTLWSIGYGVFALLTLTAMVATRRSADRVSAPAQVTAGASIPAKRVLLWVGRAAVGSSLLLSVTTRISTDVASVPLLWVVPLSIYLLTYVLAFGWAERIPRRPIVGGAFVGIAVSLGFLLAPRVFSPVWVGAVSLGTLFFGALLCHRDLAADRPPANNLTTFYLWIAVGGALGGILNSLVAPLVFDSIAEFPLTLMALAALVYADPAARPRHVWKPGPVLGVLCAAGLAMPELVAAAAAGENRPAMWAIVGVLVVAIGFAVTRYSGLMGGLTLLAGGLSLSGIIVAPGTIAQERSFFGVSRVVEQGNERHLVHGTTIHGTQHRDPVLRDIPSSYYHPDGPIGAALTGLDSAAVIGVVGLGAGAVSALGHGSQSFIFYEIDPTVVKFAREYFGYLGNARGGVRIVLGDGRLSLASTPDASHDLLLIDAFSSDFVPTHLLTTEALQLYLSKVKPDGVLILHISNRFMDFRRIVRGFSDATGVPVAIADYTPSGDAAAEGAFRTRAAALSPDPARIDDLVRRSPWTILSADIPSVQWTDQRTDLLRILR